MKTARRKVLVPVPKVADLDTLNERLLARCLERLVIGLNVVKTAWCR